MITPPKWAQQWIDFVEMQADGWERFRWTYGEAPKDLEPVSRMERLVGWRRQHDGLYLTFHHMVDISCKVADWSRAHKFSDNDSLWLADTRQPVDRDRWVVVVRDSQ